jgi:hypothetical protein
MDLSGDPAVAGNASILVAGTFMSGGNVSMTGKVSIGIAARLVSGRKSGDLALGNVSMDGGT